MNNLRKLRLEYELNMKQVADALNIPYTTYVSYEKGDREPNSEMLIRMADFYLTTVDYILNKADAQKRAEPIPNDTALQGIKMIPLLNKTIRGAHIFTDENIENTVPVPGDLPADFAVRCKGNNMTGARIYDNDIVCIKKQEKVENGEIVAVITGNEVILRRFYLYRDTVVLRTDNHTFAETVLRNEDIGEIKVLGKAVYFISKIN